MSTFISNDRQSHRLLTPQGGILQGSKPVLRCSLRNASGTGLSAFKSDLSLRVVTPGGDSETVEGSTFTDNGDGTYDVRYTFSEFGTYYGYFTYTESPESTTSRIIRDAFKIEVSPVY